VNEAVGVKKARSRCSRRRAFEELALKERVLERSIASSQGRHAVGMMETVAVVMERKAHRGKVIGVRVRSQIASFGLEPTVDERHWLWFRTRVGVRAGGGRGWAASDQVIGERGQEEEK